MGMLAWVMMGLAIWHFTIFLPDRFWGGIVGAFVGALLGSFLFGFIVNGFTIPGESDTHLLTALEALAEGVGGGALEPAELGLEGLEDVRVVLAGDREAVDDEAEDGRAQERAEKGAHDAAPEAIGDEDREVPDGEAHHDPGEHGHG